MQISKLSQQLGFSAFMVLSCAAHKSNQDDSQTVAAEETATEAGSDQGQPAPETDPLDLALSQYQSLGTYYVEDPYPMDTVFTVPVPASEILVADSMLVNRQKDEGRYSLYPIDQYQPILTSVDEGTKIVLRGSVEVGNYTILIKTKDRSFGLEMTKVASPYPIPQDGWDDEEYSTCGNSDRDCNALLKKEFLATLKARDTDRLVAQENFGGKAYRGVFIFKAKPDAKGSKYLAGTFQLSFESLSGGTIPKRFPIGLSGTCELRNGHLACRDSERDQKFYLSYRGERINTYALNFQRVNFTFR